jgi:2-phospho-L-lactate guanylyltransferase
LQLLEPTLQPARALMVPGDLPLISSSAVEEVLAAADMQPGIVIVPDRHRVGTNALLCDPPQAIAPCFGGHSFERHLTAARSAGVAARVLEIADIGLDLDVPEDFDCLRGAARIPEGTLTAPLLEALRSIEIGDRRLSMPARGVNL